MGPAQTMAMPTGLLPLLRPLMTGEMLDAAFRLFRTGLLRCLPYSSLAVLVLELPTLYETFLLPTRAAKFAIPHFQLVAWLAVLALSTALLGVITLRLQAVSLGKRPRVRTEIATVVRRWPAAVVATVGALGFPLLLVGLGPVAANLLPGEALIVVAIPLLWPTALFIAALPAFWCDRLGPLAAVAQGVRVSLRQSWRTVGAILATACIVMVFYILAAILLALFSPLMGRADLVLIAAVRSMLTLVVGAFGVPFVLAVLVVAYEDLKLRHRMRREARR